MTQQLQTLKGFRDFLPDPAKKRQHLIEIIRNVFERFGFEPLETPALEYESLLLGKYGPEADKLIYGFEDRGGRRVALRYDQTIPTARVTSQYRNDLVFPFKRYQIQPVWRAEKPQKGRYREFIQCDVDILGSSSPISDAEILACTYFSFKEIHYPGVKLHINDRQILISTLDPYASDTVSVFSIIQCIDKLAKIGVEGVVIELTGKGLSEKIAHEALRAIQSADVTPALTKIMGYAMQMGIPEADVVFSPTLARGLDYYTGMIFEVIIPEYTAGSLGGGGRYDKLIGMLGGYDVPAVGIAFGFDRMIDAANQFGLLEKIQTPPVLVTIFGNEYVESSLQCVYALHQNNIAAQIYPSEDKLDKQLKYANKKGLEYVIIIGPEENTKKMVQLKNLNTREQRIIPLSQAINILSKKKK